VGVGDPAAQTEQVIRNMRIALGAVGAELRDLVKVTVYTTDLRFLPEIDAVRRRHFTESLPISTLLEVRKLSRPEYLIEIDGIAVIE
jgi:enamine deaminase RidA (YjgF/YER057c/UK114 family)